MRKTAVSFTGGKDSTLTIHLLTIPPENGDEDLKSRLEKCSGSTVELLVTFVPAGGAADFKAHPLNVMALQAEAMGIKHITMEVGEPYLDSYKNNIRRLKDEFGITVLATGDMMDVSQGFMPRAVEGTGVELLTPLWEMDRQKVLDLVWHYKMCPLITCINTKLFGLDTDQSNAGTGEGYPTSVPPVAAGAADARTEALTEDMLLGNFLTRQLHQDVLVPAARLRGVDECGERGEYHTMVCDGARFAQRVELEHAAGRDGVYSFRRILTARLAPKP
jgi:diphthine-ammonia ligase